MDSRQNILLVIVTFLMASLPLRAEDPLYDVDVSITNDFEKDFKDLPVFLRISHVFGRGVDFARFNRDGFHILDESGKEIAFSYRSVPPFFSMANDELVVVLGELTKGTAKKLRFINTAQKSKAEKPFDISALLENPNNMIPNAGFEKGAEGWTGGKIVEDVVKSGKKALLMEVPGRGGKLGVQCAKRLTFKKGKNYHFSVWAKCENVVRHSYRWEHAGCRVSLSANPLTLPFKHKFGSKNPLTHFRIMDTRDWYCYQPRGPKCRIDGESQLTANLNHFFKPFVDAAKPARVWLDDILLFEQPQFKASHERTLAARTKEGFFIYRRAATCTGSYKHGIEAPKVYEQISRISDKALRGERKLLTLGVHATKPIENLSLDLTDLTGPGESTIGKDTFEVEFNYIPTMNWKMHPTSLEGWCIDGNVPRSTDRPGFVDFFIGVRVPTDAKAGMYNGTIKVRSGETELASVPVELEVADCRLAVITDRFMGEIYNNGCGPNRKYGAVLPRRDTKYYKYYSRCNYTMMMMFSRFLPFKGRGPEVDLEKLKASMKEMRDVAGCTAGVGLYWDCSLDKQGGRTYGGSGLWTRCGRNREAYRAQIMKIDKTLAEANLPRFVYMVWDEPRFFDKRLQILKGTGALTTADIFSNEMFAALKDKCFTHTSCDDPSYEPGPMLYKHVKKLGIRMGMAGWPSQHCTRYQTGMLYATSNMNYWHHWYGNQFIGWHKHHNAFVRGSNIVGTGEGMIDLRYYETLKRAIAQAREKNTAEKEIAAAEAYLKEIFSYCTGDWHWVGIANGTAQQWGDDWFYDRWRSRMLEHTLSIMGKRQTTTGTMKGPKGARAKPKPTGRRAGKVPPGYTKLKLRGGGSVVGKVVAIEQTRIQYLTLEGKRQWIKSKELKGSPY